MVGRVLYSRRTVVCWENCGILREVGFAGKTGVYGGKSVVWWEKFVMMEEVWYVGRSVVCWKKCGSVVDL